MLCLGDISIGNVVKTMSRLQHPFSSRFRFAFFFGLICLGFGFWHLCYDVNANADFSFAIAALLLAGAAFDYFRGDGKDKGSSAMPVKTRRGKAQRIIVSVLVEFCNHFAIT